MMNQLFYKEIRPMGWMKTQLEIQARGLSGNLDKIWPDVRDSAWIGGSCEGWERVPYWLDGFIPLAYLLQDEDLIRRADHYVHSIIDQQQEDGWICPCTVEERSTYDTWAVLLISKVLALYCEFTESEKAENALYRAMKNLHELMTKGDVQLFSWGKFRWYEGFIPLLFLYEKRPEAWMKELGRMLRAQGAHYPDYQESWKRPLNKWTYHTHIVNLMMMFKYEAVACALLGDEYENQAESLWQVLTQYNGTAVGTFTGDECLSGIGNQHGTELCAVAELMYSCEWLYRLTGEDIWAQRLEKAAFNAWPATFTDDMWAHQYDQMVNQIACEKFPGKPYFRTNHQDAHLFGLEPNFGCCTANLSQGWPKLLLHAIQKTEEGILLAHLLPCRVDTTIGGKPVQISIDSAYPFRMGAKITVSASEGASFALKIRIPAWAKNATLNGKIVQGMAVIRKDWQGTEEITLSFTAAPHFENRPYDLKTVEYGPLVFALPIEAECKMLEYEKNGVERKFTYCDYELSPKSEWRFGFVGLSLSVVEKEMGNVPFSSTQPSLAIKASLAPVHWDMEDGYEAVPAKAPASPTATGPARETELIPYGCAKLRMTELPLTQ